MKIVTLQLNTIHVPVQIFKLTESCDIISFDHTEMPGRASNRVLCCLPSHLSALASQNSNEKGTSLCKQKNETC